MKHHMEQIDELNEDGSDPDYYPTESPPVEPREKEAHKEQSQYRCGYLELIACETYFDHLVAKGEEPFSKCNEPCSYKDWGVEISSVPFPPSVQYFERYIRDKVKKSPTPTYEYIKENMARVHLYYDDLKVQKFDQTKEYEPQNFIAELGGTIDLFIGISFFTVFQFIEIIVAFCMKFVEKKLESQEPSL